MTIGTVERDKLERARALMRHRLPSGDLAAIVGEALDLLVAKLERERLGATSRPRAAREKASATTPTTPTTPTTQATPEDAAKAGISITKKRRAAATTTLEASAEVTPGAEATLESESEAEATAETDAPTRYALRPVRRAVFMRDGEQCTFQDAEGNRCPARDRLELDHIRPFAQGGEPTVENLRVRCRPHNQLHAEDCFGKAYVKKRIEMRQRGRGKTPSE